MAITNVFISEWRIRVFPCLTLALALALSGCGAPTIGEDKAAFKAVDALYTAVSLRDPEILGRCEATLRQLRAENKLPAPAAERLDAIIAEARGGGWEPAQNRLHDFILGQQR